MLAALGRHLVDNILNYLFDYGVVVVGQIGCQEGGGGLSCLLVSQSNIGVS